MRDIQSPAEGLCSQVQSGSAPIDQRQELNNTLAQLARRRCTPAGCIFSLGLALAALAAQFADILTQVREGDWSALMDTIGPLVAVVVFFCAVTLALNLLAAAMGQKRK